MAAALSAALVVLFVWGLVAALAVSTGGLPQSALKLFGVMPPPVPKREPIPRHRPSYRASGAAAPPALHAAASPVAAPVPIVVTPPPPPVIAAPVPFEGAQTSQGAADLAGPGTGAGGQGDGTGNGGSGRGDGAGDVAPRQTGGRIRDKDYPREAGEQGVSGTVGVRFVVAIDGRVPRCQVTRSSGSDVLDQTTCRLIVQRYRYKPAHDAHGHPFEAVIVQNEGWYVHRAEAPADEED